MNTVTGINFNPKTKIQNSAEANAKKAFNLLVILLWTRYTVVAFLLQTLSYLPYVRSLSGYIFPTVAGVLTLLALPYIKRRIRLWDVLVLLLGVLFLVVSPVLWPDNAKYINEQFSHIALTVLPMYLVGVCYDHASIKNHMFWASFAGSGTIFMYQIYQLMLGREMLADGMHQAYMTLPGAMYLIYWAFEKNSFKYWALALISAVFVSSFGTRGPLVILLVFIAIRFFIKFSKTKSGIVQFLVIIGTMIGLFVLLSGNILVDIAEFLSEKLGNWGFSTRVFDYFLEGNFADGSGRENISSTLLEAIKAHPAFGYGLMGDRVIAGNYAHNLFLELWCQSGVIFGTIVALVVILVPVFSVKKQQDSSFSNFILMLACTVLVKLMLSNSYLLEPNLFLLLGISIASLRQSKQFPKTKNSKEGDAI